MKKNNYLVFGVIVMLLIIFASGCTSNPKPKSCSLEAKICPDGSGVQRNPDNNCEFDPCSITEAKAAAEAPFVELEATVTSLYLDELYEDGELDPRDRASIRIDKIDSSSDPNNTIRYNVGQKHDVRFLYSARPAKLKRDLPSMGTSLPSSDPSDEATSDSASVSGSSGTTTNVAAVSEVDVDGSETITPSTDDKEGQTEFVDGYIIYHLPESGVSETILPGVEQGSKIKIKVWGGSIRGRSPNLYIEIGEYDIIS